MSSDLPGSPPGIEMTRHIPEGERTLPGDVRDGLTTEPKALPPKHFYDRVGSELFEQITRLPEYYPTRAEREILETQGSEIAALCPTAELVELGSGSAEKALLLVEPMLTTGELRSYTAVDVSESALAGSLEEMVAAHPELPVEGHVADMTRHLGELPPPQGLRTVALLGGTIGNFSPSARVELLGAMGELAGPDGHLLIGCDLVKDPDVLVAAYDDPQGVTARFNLNLLTIINRELGGDFDLAEFEHLARWNPEEEWIEMRLRAKRDLTVTISELALAVEFSEGEELLTETSAKFTPERIAAELAEGGLEVTDLLTDPADRFALVVAEPISA
ncbi:MAG: L-histidine N(alpha)-methyltransferase [Solirubrobacterales bacterium]